MNLFELFIKVGVDDQASNKLKDLGGKLGNGLKTAAKIGTTAVVAASTAIVALTKNAVESYAEYEQLVGGAQLMFGKAYDTVAKNAQEAYKTVQMSQNEYLQQVNGFATGLKTALGGNEQAAAKLADRIVTAEADIIAATGNTAENVQNAFNGIMRSNFTMLDNLQIGITPTKEGFQEVIDKVNEWNTANGKATQYQMGNLADMQSALVDYIDMVGYSGYAQAEASKTIQGSLASTKAAWKNLLTGLADDEADFESLVKNFVSSVAGDGSEQNPGLFSNVLPRIKTALDGVGELIDELFPVIVDKIPAIITDMLPKLAESAVKIVESLMNGISQNQEKLVTTAFSVVNTLVNGVLRLLPQIVELGLNLLVALATGIAENIDTLIPAIVDVVMQMCATLTDPATLSLVNEAIAAILFALVDGIIAAMPILLEQAPVIVVNLVSAIIENAPKLVEAAFSLVSHFITSLTGFIGESVGNVAQTVRDWFNTSILQPITNFVTQTWNKIVSFFAPLIGFVSPILQALKELFDTIWEAIKILVGRALDNIKSKISTVWNSIVSVLTAILNTIKNIVSSAFNSLYSAVEGPLNRVKSIVSNAFNTVRNTIYSVVQSAWTWGADMIQNFINGITAKASALVAKVRAVAQSVRDYVGFSEPKKGPLSNFHTYAPDMMDLFMKGIQDNKPRLLSVVADTFDFRENMAGFSTDNITSSYGSHRNTGSSYGVGGVSVVQNIYSQAKTAADLMQEARYQQERAVLFGV